MKGINYITSDKWWDTDVDVLPSLCEEYSVNVFCYTQTFKGCAQKFKTKFCSKAKKFYNWKMPFRTNNPLAFVLNFWYFFKVLRVSRQKGAINYYVYGSHSLFMNLFLLFFSTHSTIVCFHNYVEHSGKNSPLKQRFLKKFKYFHFHSEIEYLQFKNDHPQKKAFFSQMPPKDFGEPHNINSIKKNTKTLLFFGLIKPYKRLDLFISAAKSFLKDNCTFLIVGNCDNWESYSELIEKCDNIEADIRFVGNDEIPDIFTKSDVLILPYDDATQSGPSLIAINYGLPIIASNLQAFRNFVMDGVNGYLFEKGDVNDLIKQIRRFLSLSEKESDIMHDNQLKLKQKFLNEKSFSFCFTQFLQNNKL